MAPHRCRTASVLGHDEIGEFAAALRDIGAAGLGSAGAGHRKAPAPGAQPVAGGSSAADNAAVSAASVNAAGGCGRTCESWVQVASANGASTEQRESGDADLHGPISICCRADARTAVRRRHRAATRPPRAVNPLNAARNGGGHLRAMARSIAQTRWYSRSRGNAASHDLSPGRSHAMNHPGFGASLALFLVACRRWRSHRTRHASNASAPANCASRCGVDRKASWCRWRSPSKATRWCCRPPIRRWRSPMPMRSRNRCGRCRCRPRWSTGPAIRCDCRTCSCRRPNAGTTLRRRNAPSIAMSMSRSVA